MGSAPSESLARRAVEGVQTVHVERRKRDGRWEAECGIVPQLGDGHYLAGRDNLGPWRQRVCSGCLAIVTSQRMILRWPLGGLRRRLLVRSVRRRVECTDA